MYEPGKMCNVIQEMQRLNIDILGITDTRWLGAGNFSTSNRMIYFSVNQDQHHRYGLAVVVSKRMTQSVTDFSPVSCDRILLLQLQTKSAKLNIIQIYAPTAEKSDDEIIYKSKRRHTHPWRLQLQNWERKKRKICGRLWPRVKKRQKRRDKMLQFCQGNVMIILNTFFKLPKRRLYTWTCPQHKILS